MAKMLNPVTSTSYEHLRAHSNKSFFIAVMVVLVIVVLRLWLYGFNITEDTNCWLVTAQFFRQDTGVFSHHCLFNPIFPLVGVLIQYLLHTDTVMAFAIVNIGSFLVTCMLLYKYCLLVFSKQIAVISALLFGTSFVSIYYGFAVQPDSLTWLFQVSLLIIIWQITHKKNNHLGNLALLTLVSFIAVLLKTNFAFLVLAIAMVLVSYQPTRWWSLAYLVIVGALVAGYFGWAYEISGKFPWTSFGDGIQTQQPTLSKHLTAVMATYLYVWPFVLFGFSKSIRTQLKQLPLFAMIISTLIPVFIWPYVSPRFYYLLFPFVLPVVANGIWAASNRITKKKSYLVTIVLVLIITSANFLRMYLTLHNLTHFGFITMIVDKIL